MNTFGRLVVPWCLLLIAAVGAFIADRAAQHRRRETGGDSGDYWASVVRRVCLLLSVPLFVVCVAQLDLIRISGLPPRAGEAILLLAPFAAWTALLLSGLAEKPGDRQAGRWLAGGLGAGPSRKWVLVWTLPLASILVSTFRDLGISSDTYPPAVWGTLGVLLISLIGVAFSSATPSLPPEPAQAALSHVEPHALQPWPEALASRGIALRHLVSWPATPPSRAADETARPLTARLQQLGAANVAPELVEAVDALLGDAARDDGNSRLIFAPDHSGQAEVAALAADVVEQRFRAATLVITAGDPRPVATALKRWLPAGRRVAIFDAAGEIEPDILVTVTDAQTLSDTLLPKFKNPMLLKRFGLIVWWQLDAYSGVLAANLWAISRRLYRLVNHSGRAEVRTLAFARDASHGDAQLGAFIRRLLPQPFARTAVVNVDPRFPRPVHLHLLESHAAFFERGDGRNVHEKQRHLPLVAARVSAEEGWPTSLEVPNDIDEFEATAFLQLTAGERTLRRILVSDSSESGAEIRKIDAADVLSIAEIVSHGGRMSADGLPHHVGIPLPTNPYAAYLLSTLATHEGRVSTSRRLVSASPQPEVMRRHLLLALDELPDTWSGLQKDFLWNEAVIRRTLDEIANDGQLTRNAVRFLDGRKDLKRDHEYKSQRGPIAERRPLDTVGAALVDVRDTAGAQERDAGIRMQVDPERLTIQAYPLRVFVKNGRRYRIHEWHSIEDTKERGFLRCDRENIHSFTWRVRHASVFGIEPDRPPVAFGRQQRAATRTTASLHYEERVYGVLPLVPNLTTGIAPDPVPQLFARPITQSFATRALMVRFPGEPEEAALCSVAQALRDVLPVHLGVEEDALEVVPLVNETVKNRQVFGIAIVDLYPRGIGLVEEIADDDGFLLRLFERSCAWLSACPCQSEQGCARCLRSPAALAASEQKASRAAALQLLRKIT